MTQAEAVKIAIEKFGGIATLGQINQTIFDISDCVWKTKTPFASIRRIVRHTLGIYRIKPGLYGLEEYRKRLESKGIVVETESNENSEEINLFNHSYYQGILLELGNLKNFQTFVPNQDKNRTFLCKKLGDLRTVTNLPPFSFSSIVKRCSTIDTVWLNERNFPHSLYEVEHSTDIQNSLLKFNDLQDFNCRMYIVANGKRKEEYLKKIHYSAFSSLLNPGCRVEFIDYESLIRQYELTVEMSQMSNLL